MRTCPSCGQRVVRENKKCDRCDRKALHWAGDKDKYAFCGRCWREWGRYLETLSPFPGNASWTKAWRERYEEFLNIIPGRTARGKSLVTKKSKCDRCGRRARHWCGADDQYVFCGRCWGDWMPYHLSLIQLPKSGHQKRAWRKRYQEFLEMKPKDGKGIPLYKLDWTK